MKHCTNCGQQSSSGVCRACGVKRGKTQNNCGWCGEQLQTHAVICTKCGEKTKSSKIMPIISILAALFTGIFTWFTFIEDMPLLSTVLFAIATILLLPPVQTVIRNATHGNKGVRAAISGARVLIVIALAVGGFLIGGPGEFEFEIYNDVAARHATVVFHEEVRLHAVDSFVLNDSTTTFRVDPNNSNRRAITVVLDYSAQVVAGGMRRDSHTITMYFNVRTGNYYRQDGTRIIP